MEKINTPEENIFDMIKRLDLGEKSILEVVTEIDKLRHDKVSLLDDVRRLVEAVGKYASLAGGVHEAGCPEDDTCSCHVMVQFEKAIAAVERHME